MKHHHEFQDARYDSSYASAEEGGRVEWLSPIRQEPIKTVEQEHSWMWFAYAGVILVTIAACAALAYFRSHQ